MFGLCPNWVQYHGIPPTSSPFSMGKTRINHQMWGDLIFRLNVQCSLKFWKEKKNCTYITLRLGSISSYLHFPANPGLLKSRTGYCFQTTIVFPSSNATRNISLQVSHACQGRHPKTPQLRPLNCGPKPHLRLLRGDLLRIALHPLRGRLRGRGLRSLRGGCLGGLKGLALEGWENWENVGFLWFFSRLFQAIPRISCDAFLDDKEPKLEMKETPMNNFGTSIKLRDGATTAYRMSVLVLTDASQNHCGGCPSAFSDADAKACFLALSSAFA